MEYAEEYRLANLIFNAMTPEEQAVVKDAAMKAQSGIGALIEQASNPRVEATVQALHKDDAFTFALAKFSTQYRIPTIAAWSLVYLVLAALEDR